jgi:hypothetical protein
MPRVRIIVFLSAVLTIWLAAVTGQARYFCRMMDRVLDEPCCPSVSPLDEVSSESRASSPDCCQRLTAGGLRSVVARDESLKPLSSPGLPWTAVLEVPPAAQQETFYASSREQAPLPARGPPLFLKNCALLI